MLEPGDKAPDFTLVDQHGDPFTLSESLKRTKTWQFLYFYPKADTPGCTTQACGLRDAMTETIEDKAVVIGISPDPPQKQKKFDDKYTLGFPLLSDEDHSTAEAYGTWGERSMYGKKYMGIIRSAFLIDPKGTITEAWYKVSPKDTPANLLKALGL